MERTTFIKTLSVGKFLNPLKRKRLKKRICGLIFVNYGLVIIELTQQLKKNLKFHKLVLKLFNKLKIKRTNDKYNKLSSFKKIKLSNNKNIKINNNFISFYTKNFVLKLNLKKGLTIDQFTDKTVSKNPLFGTIYQGQLDYLENLSDYYSGHFNLFLHNNLKKITDISIQDPKLSLFKKNSQIYLLTSKFKFTELGTVDKSIEVNLKREKYI